VTRIGRRFVTGRAVAAVALALTGCSSATSTVDSPATTAPGPRPSSPAVVEIVEPRNGETVRGSGVALEIELNGAALTDVTTQDISGAQGHLHVSVDGELISMTSGLTQPLPDLERGRHIVRVEFVAGDHLPFDPRVVTQGFFEVR
jgi:hypothetical protein